MLASTLIKRLQEQIDLRGDLPVYGGHPTKLYPVDCAIKEVDFIHKGSKTVRGEYFIGGKSWPNCIRVHMRGD
jgi:hypothetical protein